MNNFHNVTIGADPELFFVEARTNIPRSAEGLLGGDKHHPVQMQGLAPGFMVQEDNAAAEFNIPPCTSLDGFTKSIHESLRYIGQIAKKNRLKLAIVPDLDFPIEQLATKHCQTLGCDPDFNCWTEQENPAPRAPETMRTAAGHIHIGWNKPDWEQVMWMARAFDLFVTVPSLLVTEPNRRRQLYGKAGACRPKKYGVECRSVDNFWLAKKSYQEVLWANVLNIVEHMNDDATSFTDLIGDYGSMIVETINGHDRAAADYLCQKFGVHLF